MDGEDSSHRDLTNEICDEPSIQITNANKNKDPNLKKITGGAGRPLFKKIKPQDNPREEAKVLPPEEEKIGER